MSIYKDYYKLLVAMDEHAVTISELVSENEDLRATVDELQTDLDFENETIADYQAEEDAAIEEQTDVALKQMFPELYLHDPS